MHIFPVRTKILLPPKDDLYSAIDDSDLELQDGDILCVTSKVLALHQGRCVPIEGTTKEELVISEADAYLPESQMEDRLMLVTIVDGVLIPNAGIDLSKLHGYYILWPRNIVKELRLLHERLTVRFKVKNLGLLATDTRSTPLRLGFSGVAVGSFGFKPLYSYKGETDVFGNPIQSRVNIVDALAQAAVLVMGEGSERTPLAIVRGAPHIEFSQEGEYEAVLADLKTDIFRPLFKDFIETLPNSGGGQD